MGVNWGSEDAMSSSDDECVAYGTKIRLPRSGTVVECPAESLYDHLIRHLIHHNGTTARRMSRVIG